MPFGYKAAEQAMSRGFQGLTGSISQMLMGDYMRKQEEELTIGKEERMFAQRKKELEITFKQSKELTKLRADYNAENDQVWENDPYVKVLFNRVKSGEATEGEVATVRGIMDIKKSLSGLEPPTDEQFAFMQSIEKPYPTIAMGLYDGIMRGRELLRKADIEKDRINAMWGGREATGMRAERAYRVKKHEKLKKTPEDIRKKIAGYQEKLTKEEDKARVETEEEGLPTEVTGFETKPTKKFLGVKVKEGSVERIPKEEGLQKPKNIKLIEFYRKEIETLERQHEVAIKKMEREVETTSPRGAGANSVDEILNEIRAGNIPAEITSEMDKDPELSFEMAVEKYVRWKLGIKK